MRKLLLYGFLGLMCYHLLGFFTYFEWKRFEINQQVKHALKRAIPEKELTEFHFSLHEIQQLKWIKSHEFVLHGHYFDVIKKTKTSKGIFIQCISDDQETSLFKQLRTMTSVNLGNLGKDQPVNLWFKFLSEPMEKHVEYELNIPKEFKTVSEQNQVRICFLTNSSLFQEDPPPQMLS